MSDLKNAWKLDPHVKFLSQGYCLVCSIEGKQTGGVPSSKQALGLLRKNCGAPGHVGVALDGTTGHLYIDAHYFQNNPYHIAAAISSQIGDVVIDSNSIRPIPITG